MSILATHEAMLDLLTAFGIPTADVRRVVVTAEVCEATTVEVTYVARGADSGHIQRTYEVVAREIEVPA